MNLLHHHVSEAAWQRTVLDLAERTGWRAVHFFDSRRSVGAGFPDILAARAPRIVAIELKTMQGRVTRQQTEWLEELARCGVETMVARPSDFEAVKKLLVGR